ncbi:MAG: hypothetical protein AAGN46_17280, partial [Acidobacteriota bacterium]
MLKKISVLAASAALLLTASAQASEPADLSVDDLLAKYADARGGRQAWQDLNAVRIEGKALIGPQMEAPFTVHFEKPEMVHFEMSIQGNKMVQAFDGTTGWMIVPGMGSGAAREMSAAELSNVRQQADLEGPLIDYEAKGNQVALVGLETLDDGTEAYHLTVKTESGDGMDVW